MSDLFIQVNTDLAYARTYYPKSKVVTYLNGLASTAYHKIYGKKKHSNSLLSFWAEDIPLLMYQYRKYFYLSFAILGLMVAIGWLSSVYEPEFVRVILSDQYVEMTKRNIENGDPLAVYNNDSKLGDFNSFLNIMLNNLRVGIIGFLYGILGGIGSIYFIMVNGVMVGAFQHMFYEEGHFFLSLRTIWMHGSMEIFGMCIEYGAGILLGTSYLFPGMLTRKQAFFIKGKAAFKILLSVLPFTVFAALIEGYLTQYANELPIFVPSIIVLGTLGFISWYYLIYPVTVYKRYQGDIRVLYDEIANEKS